MDDYQFFQHCSHEFILADKTLYPGTDLRTYNLVCKACLSVAEVDHRPNGGTTITRYGGLYENESEGGTDEE